MQKNNVRDAEWRALRDKIGDKYGDAVVCALRDLFEVYDDRMVKWLAELYDPRIGGWYYSNSARDNEFTVRQNGEFRLLPDVESTKQALSFMSDSGMTEKGKTFVHTLPETVKKKIGEFVLSLQEEDGYFYHPQWGRAITTSRKGRDFGSSLSILSQLGITPKFTPPTASDASKSYDMKHAPERYKSEESYLSYLHAMDMETKSYHSGSELLAQTPELKAYSNILDKDLVALTVDWLNERQHPESGIWHSVADYYGVNGIHKLTQFYNSVGKEFPNAEAAYETTLSVILSDVSCGAAVDVYNPWHVLGALVGNVGKFGENGAERAAAMIETTMKTAERAIGISKKKVSAFKKADGSFSYLPDYACPSSQGAPVAIPYLPEGDVNGNCISSTALVNSIYSALGIGDAGVKIFTPAEGELFVKIIKEAEAKI